MTKTTKKNKFPPIYSKIKGQEGYKTKEEIIEHLKKKFAKEEAKKSLQLDE